MGNRITAYLVEVGVTLKSDDPEFNTYRDSRFKNISLYDEDTYYVDDIETAIEFVKEYVTSGVEGTYGIVSTVNLNLSVDDLDEAPIEIPNYKPDVFLVKKNDDIIDYTNAQQYNIVVNDSSLTVNMKHMNTYYIDAKHIIFKDNTIKSGKFKFKIKGNSKPKRIHILKELQKEYSDAIALFDITIFGVYLNPIFKQTSLYKYAIDSKKYIYDNLMTDSKTMNILYNEVHNYGKE